ncbi:hypothetical protein PRIPAC_94939, partial [Pristionchus pacificus]
CQEVACLLTNDEERRVREGREEGGGGGKEGGTEGTGQGPRSKSRRRVVVCMECGVQCAECVMCAAEREDLRKEVRRAKVNDRKRNASEPSDFGHEEVPEFMLKREEENGIIALIEAQIDRVRDDAQAHVEHLSDEEEEEREDEEGWGNEEWVEEWNESSEEDEDMAVENPRDGDEEEVFDMSGVKNGEEEEEDPLFLDPRGEEEAEEEEEVENEAEEEEDEELNNSNDSHISGVSIFSESERRELDHLADWHLENPGTKSLSVNFTDPVHKGIEMVSAAMDACADLCVDAYARGLLSLRAPSGNEEEEDGGRVKRARLSEEDKENEEEEESEEEGDEKSSESSEEDEDEEGGEGGGEERPKERDDERDERRDSKDYEDDYSFLESDQSGREGKNEESAEDTEIVKSEEISAPGEYRGIFTSIANRLTNWMPSLSGMKKESKEKKNMVEPERECAQANSAERETTNGMERSMVKSRSSESIASTSESSQMFPSAPVNPLRATESDEEGESRERRSTRTSSASGEALAIMNGGGSTVTSSSTATPSPSTTTASSSDLRTMLDNDGLVRFSDPAQESARKRFAELEENVSKKKEERQRMRSEMSDVSIGGRADDEPFQMDDIMSDASIVDEHEIFYAPRHNGTQVNASHCSVCRHAFNFANHKMNCNSCGRAVCASCSSHSYMETSDGVARTRKACTDCYCKMHSTPTPLTPSSHLTTSNGGGSGCPDGESTPTRSPYVSPSQAVRG